MALQLCYLTCSCAWSCTHYVFERFRCWWVIIVGCDPTNWGLSSSNHYFVEPDHGRCWLLTVERTLFGAHGWRQEVYEKELVLWNLFMQYWKVRLEPLTDPENGMGHTALTWTSWGHIHTINIGRDVISNSVPSTAFEGVKAQEKSFQW